MCEGFLGLSSGFLVSVKSEDTTGVSQIELSNTLHDRIFSRISHPNVPHACAPYISGVNESKKRRYF